MPTLAQVLQARLTANGWTVGDVSLVEWNDSTWGWKPVDRSQFIALAQTVDVSLIPDANRERARFTIVPGDPAAVQRRIVYSVAAGDFVVEPQEPSIIVLTSADLTT